MRYRVTASTIAERIALLAHRVPIPVIDCLVPLVQTRALMAAVRLGIFEAMGQQTRSAAEIAQRCSLDAGALDMLLRLMISTGYVVSAGGERYRLSALGRRTVLPGGEMDLRHYVEVNYVQWRLIEHMEALLQTGRGLEIHATIDDPQVWATYQHAMLELARIAAPIVGRLVPVPRGARTLLDLGGSHGLLGAAICRRHPPMRSTVLDLPIAIGAARRLAREEGLDDIVEHRAADLLKDDFGTGADVVLLANIVHHFTPDQNVEILRRARAAMTPRGTVAIWDFERPPAGARAEAGADATALFFRLTSTSQVTTAADYERWLRVAGFTGVRSKRSVLAPVNVLTIGTCEARPR